MPNWTNEAGENRFNILECKRCLQDFTPVNGEIPTHNCIGGKYRSETSIDGINHPVYVGKLDK